MSNELTKGNVFSAPSVKETAVQVVESDRAIQEVQGMIISAKRFPRDRYKATNDILTDCERYTLAAKATYTYPKGGQTVTGPSIRLAETLAQNWGNLSYGIKEMSQTSGRSEMLAYCWDLETNTRREVNFTTVHERHTRNGVKKLTDPRDIYELTANQGARRLRACILAVIPSDVVESASLQCKKTLALGNGKKTLKQRIQDMISAFDKVGVPIDAIEKKLDHGADLIIDTELADMIGIYNALKDNQAGREDFFDIKGVSQKKETEALNKKIKGGD